MTNFQKNCTFLYNTEPDWLFRDLIFISFVIWIYLYSCLLLTFILLLVFRYNSNYKSKKYCTVLIELDLLVFAGKLYLTTVQFPQHPTHLRQYIWFHLWIWNSRSFSAAAEILALKLLPFVPAICLQIPGPVGQHTSTATKLSTEFRNWGKVPTIAFSLLKVLQCP